jgi:Excalibur calcium-binding domain
MEAKMKNLASAVICFAFLTIFPENSNAAVRVFKNCSELNSVYPGGVAMPGAVNIGTPSKKEPKYDKDLYRANQKSDRDGDGIACEK